MKVLPRLERGHALALVAGLEGLSPADAKARADQDADELELHIRYTEVGGQRLSLNELRGLCDLLRKQAQMLGYPLVACKTSDGRVFDQGVARAVDAFLADHDVPVGEAGRDGFWWLLSCGLLPDLVIWRWAKNTGGVWSSATEARYVQFNRGAFSLPWWWTRVFRERNADEPAWTVLSDLTSDNVVAIAERTSIAAQPGLGYAIARAHRLHGAAFSRLRIRRPKADGSGKMEPVGHEDLLRDVMKRLIRFGGFVEWALLTEAELDELIHEVFISARRALGDEAAGTQTAAPMPSELAAEPEDPAWVGEASGGSDTRPDLADIRMEPDDLQRLGFPSPSDAAVFALRFIDIRTAKDLVTLDMKAERFRGLSVQHQMAVRRFQADFRKAWGD